MFLHEFREDFVLALELLFQEGDPPVFGVTGASSSGFEGGGGVLEELLLPAVEHCGMDVVLVTEVRNRDAFEEMKPKDGGLLLGTGAFPSLLGHGKTSARACSLFERFVFPIPTEAEQDRPSVLDVERLLRAHRKEIEHLLSGWLKEEGEAA